MARAEPASLLGRFICLTSRDAPTACLVDFSPLLFPCTIMELHENKNSVQVFKHAFKKVHLHHREGNLDCTSKTVREKVTS